MSDEKTTEAKEEIKVSATLQKIIDQVEKLTVLELADLVKALEEKFGVSAAAPMMMGAMPAAAGEAAAPVEEKTEFDVILKDAGANKLAVIKVVRTLDQSLGLMDAKKKVEAAPQTILEAAKKEDANAAKAQLEEAGATVELK